MKYYAGLDIGGSTGRIRLKGEDGKDLGEYRCQGASFFASGQERAKVLYADLVLSALDDHHLNPQDCAGLCATASGVDSESLRRRCRQIFVELGFPENVIRIYNDCEIFLTACRPPSMILVAGTGSIVFGMKKGGQIWRTGGWGHILSDEGSGFHIGLDVIQAAGNHLDGRICDPVFFQHFRQASGIDQLEPLNQFLMDNILTKSSIAALSLVAEKAREDGSETGREILCLAAEKLFHLIKDNGKKMKVQKGDALEILLWGGVLVKNSYVREQVSRRIREAFPLASIQIPPKEAVQIALDLAAASEQQNPSFP